MGDIFTSCEYAYRQINTRHCPYSQTLLGTYSKYTYSPKQNIFFDNEMVGDTTKVFIKATWNSDVGPRVVKEYNMNIIFE